ncbi:MAG: transposase [Leptolyngbya sp. BL-A-14]
MATGSQSVIPALADALAESSRCDERLRQPERARRLHARAWVVERTPGWLMGCWHLVRGYGLLPQTAETCIYLATIRIMVRRLA